MTTSPKQVAAYMAVIPPHHSTMPLNPKHAAIAAIVACTATHTAAQSVTPGIAGKCPSGWPLHIDSFPTPPNNETCPQSWTHACVDLSINADTTSFTHLTANHFTALNRHECPTQWKIINTNKTNALQAGYKASMTSLFKNVRHTVEFTGDVSQWDTSEVVHMEYVFPGNWHYEASGANMFNGNISNWQTSNVESMDSMFQYAIVFNSDISKWDTGKVRDMESMFRFAKAFNQDISGFNTGNVEDMSNMFQDAESFNQDISGWNTSSVTTMATMFRGTQSPVTMQFAQDISCWDVSNVVTYNSMFTNRGPQTPYICNAYHMLSIFNKTGTPGRAMSDNPNFASFDATPCPPFTSQCYNYVHPPPNNAKPQTKPQSAPPPKSKSSSDTGLIAGITGGIVALAIAASCFACRSSNKSTLQPSPLQNGGKTQYEKLIAM